MAEDGRRDILWVSVASAATRQSSFSALRRRAAAPPRALLSEQTIRRLAASSVLASCAASLHGKKTHLAARPGDAHWASLPEVPIPMRLQDEWLGRAIC